MRAESRRRSRKKGGRAQLGYLHRAVDLARRDCHELNLFLIHDHRHKDASLAAPIQLHGPRFSLPWSRPLARWLHSTPCIHLSRPCACLV